MKYVIIVVLCMVPFLKGNSQMIVPNLVGVTFDFKFKFVRLQNGLSIGLTDDGKGLAANNPSTERQKITLVKYDANMNELKKNTLADNFSIYYDNIIEVNNKVWVLACEESSGNKMIGNIKAFEIDTATLQPISTKVIVSEQTLDKKITTPLHFMAIEAIIKKSPDGKKLCFIFSNRRNGFYMACLNDRLETERFTKLNVPGFNENRFFDNNNESILIDNTGNIFLSYLYNGKQKMFKYGNDGATETNNLLVNGFVPTTFKAAFNSKGNKVYVSGTYPFNSKNPNAIYSGVLNLKTFDVTDFKNYEMPLSIFQSLSKDGFASDKKGKEGIRAFEHSCRLLVNDKDELYIVIQPCNYVGGDWSYAAFGSTVIANLSAPTPQYSLIPHYAVINSMFMYVNYATPFFCGQKLLLFYYDNIDNVRQNGVGETKNLNGAKGAVLALAEILGDGTFNVTAPSVNYKNGGSSITKDDAELAIMKYLNNNCKN